MSVEGCTMYFSLALSVPVIVIALYHAFHSTPSHNHHRHKLLLGVGVILGGSFIQLHPYWAAIAPFLLFSGALMVVIHLLLLWRSMVKDRHALETMAYTDTMTGLPNRNKMNQFLESHAGRESIAVLFLDLDRFKAVNDTYGHSIGDKLVQEVGGRLRSFVNEKQQVYRMGGDEFVVVLVDGYEDLAERLADEIVRKVKQPYFLMENELHITVSIGISIGQARGVDHSLLIQQSDRAMYKAKSLGGNRYCFINRTASP